MRIKSVNLKNNNNLFSILKGALSALIISLIGILVFAFVIKLTSISDGLIKPINQTIKVISIFFGCFLVKNNSVKNLSSGLLIGVMYTILAFILFSALNGKFDFNITLFLDIIFGALIGLISSVICNIFKKA